MALTQMPAQYNVAYVPNVFTVDNIGTGDEFYIEVLINNNVVATLKQPPNPAGVAHFDVSKILQSYLHPTFVEKTPKVSTTLGETVQYRVKYGIVENGEYQPSVLEPTYFTVINGYDNWRVLNWNDSEYNIEGQPIFCEVAGSSIRYDNKKFLTNYPKDSYPLRSNSYHTLSFFNMSKNALNSGILFPGTTVQPAYVRVKFYTDGNALIQTSVYSIDATTGLGPRQAYNSTTVSGYGFDELVGTIGAGPQNLKDAGVWPNGITPQIWNQVTQLYGSNTNIWNLGPGASAVIDHYEIEIYSVDWCYWEENGAPVNDDASTLTNYLGDLLYSYEFNIKELCSPFDVINVSFVNQYGVKDYFSFDRRNTKTVTSNRNTYLKSNATFSLPTYSINQHDGGHTVFNTDIETEVAMTTNWMTDEESKWLQELYTSPTVQVEIDGEFEPAVIVSNTYEEKTYARDKMFKHTLIVKLANNKQVQRG